MILAVWMDKALIAFLPTNGAPLTISTTPDSRILAFNLAVSLLTGILFGLVPALESARPQLAGTLKEQVGSIAGGKSASVRKALVVAQVALSLLLLIGAGLFIRSLRNLKDLDPGFHTGNLIAFEINPTLNGYPPERSAWISTASFRENPRRHTRSRSIVSGCDSGPYRRRVGQQYGGRGLCPQAHRDPRSSHAVHRAGLLSRPCTSPLSWVAISGCPMSAALPRFASSMRSSLASYFKDGNALGRHIGMGGNPGTKLDIEIIGVAGDTRYESLRDEVPLEVYQLLAPWSIS